MKLLLDTHCFIWWRTAPDRLAPTVLAALERHDTTPYLSVASIWEMQIKIQLNKLRFNIELRGAIDDERSDGMIVLPITDAHVFALESLPLIHRDPFDRIIVTQANVEGLLLVTDDSQVK